MILRCFKEDNNGQLDSVLDLYLHFKLGNDSLLPICVEKFTFGGELF